MPSSSIGLTLFQLRAASLHNEEGDKYIGPTATMYHNQTGFDEQGGDLEGGGGTLPSARLCCLLINAGENGACYG